jgi:hypothetical protein
MLTEKFRTAYKVDNMIMNYLFLKYRIIILVTDLIGMNLSSGMIGDMVFLAFYSFLSCDYEMYCNNREYPLVQMVLNYNRIIQIIVTEAMVDNSYLHDIAN